MVKIFNFNYNSWNISFKDCLADEAYEITSADGRNDILEAIKEAKSLCEKSAIINTNNKYTICDEEKGINPLNEEGDNAFILLNVAKSIGYIKSFKSFSFDRNLDFDYDL